MHELPITRSLLELALRHAESAGGGRVSALYLEVGRLSGVIDRFVQFYWDIVSEGTPAAGARLHFESIAIEMACADCDTRFEPDGDTYTCPSCASTEVQVVRGDEFNLVAIDLDSGDAPARKDDGG
jgi:hydrogenase nickel incorporation protein HypA/HybF